MGERRTLGALADDRIAQLEAENDELKREVESADHFANEMRCIMLAALWGTDRSGRNAAVGRIVGQWALEQLEEQPLVENYLEVTLTSEAMPGLAALITIQRDGKETPADKAARLQVERDAAVARAEAAEARAARAEADARLMLAAYYGADSASIARFGLGDGLLSEGDLQRLDALRGATFYASEGETAAAMLRILATSGA